MALTDSIFRVLEQIRSLATNSGVKRQYVDASSHAEKCHAIADIIEHTPGPSAVTFLIGDHTELVLDVVNGNLVRVLAAEPISIFEPGDDHILFRDDSDPTPDQFLEATVRTIYSFGQTAGILTVSDETYEDEGAAPRQQWSVAEIRQQLTRLLNAADEPDDFEEPTEDRSEATSEEELPRPATEPTPVNLPASLISKVYSDLSSVSVCGALLSNDGITIDLTVDEAENLNFENPDKLLKSFEEWREAATPALGKRHLMVILPKGHMNLALGIVGDGEHTAFIAFRNANLGKVISAAGELTKASKDTRNEPDTDS
ncbi:MAG: hypothetical protein AAFQ66_19550 [Pseudomonadota bacterium]